MRKFRSTVLSCLEANVAGARKKGLRRFALEQLRAYEERLKTRRRKTRKGPVPSWDRCGSYHDEAE